MSHGAIIYGVGNRGEQDSLPRVGSEQTKLLRAPERCGRQNRGISESTVMGSATETTSQESEPSSSEVSLCRPLIETGGISVSSHSETGELRPEHEESSPVLVRSGTLARRAHTEQSSQTEVVIATLNCYGLKDNAMTDLISSLSVDHTNIYK